MRSTQPGSGDGEGQSYLVSVSDLMSSLVFIFIITIVVFALRLQRARAQLQDTRTQLTSAQETRAHLLEALRDRLTVSGIAVEIDPTQGVLRLTENAVPFPLAEDQPVPQAGATLRRLALTLDEILPCFTASTRSSPERRDGCLRFADPTRHASNVDVLLIEGHTDSRRLSGGRRFEDNLELSGARAAAVWRILNREAPGLADLRNRSGLKILSISGYADQRPLVTADPLADANRRIDLRFVMEPPNEDAQPRAAAAARDRAPGIIQ